MSAPALLRVRDDEAIVEAVRAGRPDGFDLLVARHRPAMLAFARRVLGDHRAAAEDVVQEALIRAHRALGRDEREIALGPWLLTLARNCALDELRRSRSYPLPSEVTERSAGAGDAPEHVAGRRARLKRMVEDLATLPLEQRHALLRHAVDGAAHADIAAELGVSAQASRMLVVRARSELTKIEAARDERCETVQETLLAAHRVKRRASAHAHRHLLGCPACRRYRDRLKALSGALRMLDPGPLILTAALGVKTVAAGKLVAGGGTLAGAGKSAVVTGGLAAAVSAAAIGGTVLFTAGDGSPVDVRSRALPGEVVRAGAPLPPGSSIVAKRVRVSTTMGVERLACPAGQVVADLLAPEGGSADVAYDPATVPGHSRVASVRIRGRATRTTGLAVLCRRPANGSIIPRRAGSGARAAAVADAAVCARRIHLRRRPGGRIDATARLAQPVVRLRRAGRWTRVRTDLGQTGWVPGGALCAAAG